MDCIDLLASNKGVRSGICENYLRQRALSLLAMYSRSSDTNCNAHEARTKDATSKEKATSYCILELSIQCQMTSLHIETSFNVPLSIPHPPNGTQHSLYRPS